MHRVTYALVLSVLLAGCGTTGNFTILDLDLRTPEQIEASSYTEAAPPPRATRSWIIKAIDFISVIKGRIRIGYVEWDTTREEK